MGLNKGENVYYSIMPETTQYSGTVISLDDKTIVLQTENIQNVSTGKYVVILDKDFKYYTEILNIDENNLTLKKVWGEKRSYFRVDDALPRSKKAERQCAVQEIKNIPGI